MKYHNSLFLFEYNMFSLNCVNFSFLLDPNDTLVPYCKLLHLFSIIYSYDIFFLKFTYLHLHCHCMQKAPQNEGLSVKSAKGAQKGMSSLKITAVLCFFLRFLPPSASLSFCSAVLRLISTWSSKLFEPKPYRPAIHAASSALLARICSSPCRTIFTT